MKKILLIMLTLIFIIALHACLIAIALPGCLITIALPARLIDTQPDDYFGFSKKDFTVVEEQDTHGGFLGDGSYYLILDCSNNKETALEIVDIWNNIPLSENLDLIMFGGKKDGISYKYELSEEAHIPKIENGYYHFRDRHSKATDSSDDSELFRRASFNFSLAMYDSDTNIFYYFEFDT